MAPDIGRPEQHRLETSESGDHGVVLGELGRRQNGQRIRGCEIGGRAHIHRGAATGESGQTPREVTGEAQIMRQHAVTDRDAVSHQQHPIDVGTGRVGRGAIGWHGKSAPRLRR